MTNQNKYLCRAESPNPWKTRDTLIDEILGLTAHQMQAMNILISLIRGWHWQLKMIEHGIPTTRSPDTLSDGQISWLMRSGIAYISSQIIYYTSSSRTFQVLTWNILIRAWLPQRRTPLRRRLPRIEPTEVQSLGWPWAREPRPELQRMTWIINSLDKNLSLDKTTYSVQKHASFFQRGQFNLYDNDLNTDN